MEFNCTRRHISLFHTTEECYSGKGRVVDFLNLKNISVMSHGAPQSQDVFLSGTRLLSVPAAVPGLWLRKKDQKSMKKE